MAQTIPEMAFLLDSDLSNVQLPGKHCCRLCCTTAVCEDIWKKFAFEDVEVYPTAPVFPTPPVSPCLSPEPVSDSEEERCCLEEITRSLFYDYEEDDDKDEKQQPEELESQNLFRSMLINQDCMWGSSSQPVSITDTPAPSPASLSDSELPCIESVDPSMVIPLVCRTTSNHPRHSCSSQDESDEEIDVVTVEKNKYPEKRMSHSAPETPVSSPLKKKQRLMSRVSSHSTSNRYHRHLSSSYRQRRRISRIEVERRASHNVLERKRRNDLKSSFNTLREHVPDLESNEKAPKVMILQKAACYITEIKQLDARLAEEKFEEQRRQEILLHKLHKLKEFYCS